MKSLTNKIVCSFVILALLLNAVPVVKAAAVRSEYQEGRLGGDNRNEFVQREQIKETAPNTKDPGFVEGPIRSSDVSGVNAVALVKRDSSSISSPDHKVHFQFPSNAYAAQGDSFRLVLDPDDDLGSATLPEVGRITELPYNVELATGVRDRLAADECNVEVLLTREVPTPRFLSRAERANQAIDFGADMFVTLAFNTTDGVPWGWEGDGGVEAWARSGHPDDYVLATQFFNNITAFTGRPHRKRVMLNRYSEFNALPASMTYAHVEALFLDHRFDWPVISTAFSLIVDASYLSIRTQLEAKGMTCVDPPGSPGLPRPPSAEMLQRLRNLGYQTKYQQYGMDPVSFSTGNHVISRELFSLPGPGSFDLDFTLFYNSQDIRQGYLGTGWSFPLAYTQLYSDDSVSVTLFDGRTYYYPPKGSGYESPEDVPAILERTNDGWTWTDTDGTTLTFVESKRGLGVLTELRERHGNTHIYEYDFGQITQTGWPVLLKITDAVGRVINITTEDDHITALTLPDGRMFHFEYSDGNLTAITDAKDQSYHYEYDDQSRIVKEWDPQEILFLQNFYDDRDRVVKQLDAGNAESELIYEPGHTNYVDNLDNPTHYFFDGQARVTSIVDALTHTTAYVYDEKDNVIKLTDPRGGIFEFTYDDHSNLLTERGPEDYFVEYTYNEFDDLLSVKDFGGKNGQPRITQFTVNNAGDVETVEYPDQTRIQMRYDTIGNLVSFTDENEYKTTYQYDQHTNLIQVTDPLTFETHYEYDDTGRLLKVIDALTNVVEFGYDENDNILSIKDPKRNVSGFEYDANDNLVKMTDRRGGVWLFGYDDDLKLTSETDPGGHTTSYEYDLMYNLAGVTDPNGNRTQYVYNDRYEVEQVIAANDGATEFKYDESGNLIQSINPVGAITDFKYNGLNLLTFQFDALNGRTEWVYDQVGRLIKQINPRRAQTLFSYDLRDRLIETQDALKGIWGITYDKVGNPTKFIDANTRVTQMEYDKVNRLVKRIDPSENQTTFTLDGVGNLLESRDALERVTSYQYDENSNLTHITDALNHPTVLAYDQEDNLVSVTDARDNTTRFKYNLDGLLAQMTEAGGQVSRYKYDKAHNLTRFTNAKGNSWVFAYNKLNLLSSETNPLGAKTKHEYDLAGRLIRDVDANIVATRYEYDLLDRLVAVTQNEKPLSAADVQTNVLTSYGYDEAGNLTMIRDANGHDTLFEYDLLDRLVREMNALGDSWNYDYDPVGNLTSRMDANHDKTTYTYTATDLLETVSYPDHTGMGYSYDAVGNQLSADASWLGPITNEYDELNRLTSSADHLGNTIQYGYDSVGNQTSITYPDGKKASFEYDPTNYLQKMVDPAGNAFTFRRDPTHNVTLVNYPNQTVARSVFDAADQLKAVTNARSNGALLNRFLYELDPVGNRVKTTETYTQGQKQIKAVTDYQYDPLYRLVSSSDSLGMYSKYSYDAVGNRTNLTTDVDPTLGRQKATLRYHYTYNAINALTNITKNSTRRDLSQVAVQLRAFIAEVKAQSGKGIEQDTAAALVQSATAILNQINNSAPTLQMLNSALAGLEKQVQDALQAQKITKAGVASSLLAKLKLAKEANRNSKPQKGDSQFFEYAYDKNGNRTSAFASDPNTRNKGGKSLYEYDFENRLMHVVDYADVTGGSQGNGQLRGESIMTFDAYGRLFERRFDHHAGGAGDQTASRFVYDGLDPIVEHYGPSGKYTQYYRAEGRILSMLANAGTSYAAGRARYFHYDGLNSAVSLTNHLGQSAHSYQYSDFGTILDNNGRAQDASNFTDPHNHYTYTGQEWDENTGLFHFYAREYDPFTGTWLQQDPYRGQMSTPASLHRYTYVGNSPINYDDPLGFDRTSTSIAQIISLTTRPTPTLINALTPNRPIPTPVPTPKYNAVVAKQVSQDRPTTTPNRPIPTPVPAPKYDPVVAKQVSQDIVNMVNSIVSSTTSALEQVLFSDAAGVAELRETGAVTIAGVVCVPLAIACGTAMFWSGITAVSWNFLLDLYQIREDWGLLDASTSYDGPVQQDFTIPIK
jgi:RHS repeat-associated protein